MEIDKNKLNEKILSLTLEIIFLLTGEDYTVVKKTGECVAPSSCSCVLKGWSRSRGCIPESPNSLIPERNNEQKILKLTNKMVELLTGSVPIRCQDVAVYLSMEEWEYIEGHKDLYQEVLMDEHRPLTSPATFESKNQTEELNTSDPTLSQLQNANHKTIGKVQEITEEPKPCRMEDCVAATTTQYPCLEIEDKPLCDIRNPIKLKICDLIDDTMRGSPHFMSEPCLRYDGNFSNPNMDQTQYQSTHIKEEPISYDRGNITNTDLHTPTDHTEHPSTAIKKEPVSCDEDLPKTNLDLHLDHSLYALPYIKKKPVSNDGGTLTDPNIYSPTDQIQQGPTAHVKKEPPSSHEASLKDQKTPKPTDHTEHPAPPIKEEQVPHDEDVTDTNSYTPLAPHLNTEKEAVQCNGEDLKDLNIHTTIDNTQQNQPSQAKMELDSNDRDNLTNPYCTVPADNTPQCPLEEEPVFVNEPSIREKKSSSLRKPEEKDLNKRKDKEPEQNYKDIMSSKTYFCTIQQTTDSLEILYNCPECPESFTSNLDLAKHQIVHTGGMPFTCTVCGRCFGRKSDLGEHLLTHEFGCPHCELCFATKSSLIIHERTHLQNSPLPCLECGKTFQTQKTLTRHQEIHSNQRPFQCPECEDSFKRKAHLQRHQAAHEKARQLAATREKKRALKCSAGAVSDRVEKPKYQVKHIWLKPIQSSPYKIPHNSKTTFQVHHRLHTCPECPKSFTSKSSLQMHQRIHAAGQSTATPEDKVQVSKDSISFPCVETCTEDPTFTSSESGDHFINAKRKKKPPYKSLQMLPCPLCGKCFSSEYNLRRHHSNHTEAIET